MLRDYMGHSPAIDATAWVDESAVVIGQVSIGANASVWPNVTIRGDVNWISIGEGSNIQDNSVIHVTHSGSEFQEEGSATTIGNWVTIGHGAIIHGCTIKDYSLIGMGAIVLDNAIVESEVMVAAGALVASGKVLESGYLYVGSPAKKARPLTEREIAFLHFSPEHYAKVALQHKNESNTIK